MRQPVADLVGEVDLGVEDYMIGACGPGKFGLGLGANRREHLGADPFRHLDQQTSCAAGTGVDEATVLTEGNSLPIGRVARANEVAMAVLFLASDGSSYITGTAIPVTGGMELFNF